MSEIEDKAIAMAAESMELLAVQNTPSWGVERDDELELRFDEEPLPELDSRINELERSLAGLVQANPSLFVGKEQCSAYFVGRS